jgi:hypothetical protein
MTLIMHINHFFQREPNVLLQSDASKTAWRGVYGSQTTGGSWSSTEINSHINVLELLAAYFTIRTFCTYMQNVHSKLMPDNQTTSFYPGNASVILSKSWGHTYRKGSYWLADYQEIL